MLPRLDMVSEVEMRLYVCSPETLAPVWQYYLQRETMCVCADRVRVAQTKKFGQCAAQLCDGLRPSHGQT